MSRLLLFTQTRIYLYYCLLHLCGQNSALALLTKTYNRQVIE